MLRNLIKNIKSHYTLGIKKTYKTFYFQVILNYHNQIKAFIEIIKRKRKKKLLKECLKLKLKYTKKVKKLFTNQSIYRAFIKASEHTVELTQFKKENNITKNISKISNKCIIFHKSITIKENIDVKKTLSELLKTIKTTYTVKKQINVVEGIFENIFLNMDKYKLYIPIFVTNIGRYIIPRGYRYLDIKLFYEFLKDESVYSDSNFELFLKRMRISKNTFESDDMFIEEIDEDENPEYNYIVVCNNNSDRNNSKLWRKLDFYKFMYNYIYTKNLTKEKTRLMALKQLLNYLFDVKIYKKYTTKIWVPFSKSPLKRIYTQTSNKKIYDNNISSFTCLSNYMANLPI